jgi:predicted TPR repeat methyltransferase
MPEPARIAVTDAEIDAAIGRAREYAKYARNVVRASYSKVSDRVHLVLSDGATYTIPRRLLQGLNNAAESDLVRIRIIGGGSGLLWPILDVSHYVPALLQGVYGSEKWMTSLNKRRRTLMLVDAKRGSKRGRASF